jgi:hypothetical protein
MKIELYIAIGKWFSDKASDYTKYVTINTREDDPVRSIGAKYLEKVIKEKNTDSEANKKIETSDVSIGFLAVDGSIVRFPRYLITKTGSAKLIDNAASREYLTFGDLNRLEKHGLIKGDISRLYVGVSQGLGAAAGMSPDFYWQLFQIFSPFIISVSANIARKFNAHRKLKKILKLTASLKEKHGFRTISDIREFIELKDYWKAYELMELIDINEKQSKKLLEALGYVFNGQAYIALKDRAQCHARARYIKIENSSCIE